MVSGVVLYTTSFQQEKLFKSQVTGCDKVLFRCTLMHKSIPIMTLSILIAYFYVNADIYLCTCNGERKGHYFISKEQLN